MLLRDKDLAINAIIVLSKMTVSVTYCQIS